MRGFFVIIDILLFLALFGPYKGHFRTKNATIFEPKWGHFLGGKSDRFWVNSGSCWVTLGSFWHLVSFGPIWVFLPFSLPVFCGVSNGHFAFSWVIFWEVQCNIRGNFPPPPPWVEGRISGYWWNCDAIEEKIVPIADHNGLLGLFSGNVTCPLSPC